METPAPAKSKHKAETPDIIVVTDRVHHAGVSLPGFPGHAAEAFHGEVKKVCPCGDWLGVHREDGTYRAKKV